MDALTFLQKSTFCRVYRGRRKACMLTKERKSDLFFYDQWTYYAPQTRSLIGLCGNNGVSAFSTFKHPKTAARRDPAFVRLRRANARPIMNPSGLRPGEWLKVLTTPNL